MSGNIGLIPGLALRIFMGYTCASLTQETSIIKSDMLVLGLVTLGTSLCVVGSLLISSIAKEYLKSIKLQ
jgi:hypothetical protein